MSLLKSILPTYFTCVPWLLFQCDNVPLLADSFPLFNQKLYKIFDWKKQIRNRREVNITILMRNCTNQLLPQLLQLLQLPPQLPTLLQQLPQLLQLLQLPPLLTTTML